MSYTHRLADRGAHPSGAAPAARGPVRRISVVSASVGAGHDGAAAELARRLEVLGYEVDRHDFLDLLPAGAGRLLSGTYHGLLTWAPSVYEWIYSASGDGPGPGPAVRALFRGAERRTLAALPPGTAAVVSTYPGASQVLGRLRLRGRLPVPALTYLTDFSVHPLWVAPGIDAHLATHPVPAGQAYAQGAAAVTASGPVVDPRFTPTTAAGRRAARARFGLPEHDRLALLVAGSWGVGDVRKAAVEIRNTGAAVPVVMCGRNRVLAGRLHEDGIEHAYGWVQDMPALMQAADVLVQNAGGLSSLEAFASGLPVVSYRCIPGHGRANAAALHEAGLAAWVRDPGQLGAMLRELLDGRRGGQQRAAGLALYRAGHGPEGVIASAAVHGSPAIPARRTRRPPVRRRVAAAGVAAAATVLLGVGAPLAEAYSDSPGGLTGLTHVLEGEQR